MNIKNQYLAKIPVFVRRLTDVGYVGQLVFVVIVLLTSWSGIKTIRLISGYRNRSPRSISKTNFKN